MHAARPRDHRRDLYTLLAAYLHCGGATIRYATLAKDAHWCAASRTLTLRADADDRDHLDVLIDLIDIAADCPSQLGATHRRHLQAVAG